MILVRSLILILIPFSSICQSAIDLRLGMNISSQKSNARQITINNAQHRSILLGVIYENQLSDDFGFQTGIIFQQDGVNESDFIIGSLFGTDVTSSYDERYSYLRIPFGSEIHIGSFDVFLGTTFGYLLYAKQKIIRLGKNMISIRFIKKWI